MQQLDYFNILVSAKWEELKAGSLSPTFPGEAWWCKRSQKTASRHFVLRTDGDRRHQIVFILTRITFDSDGRAPNFDNLNRLAWSGLKDGIWPDDEEEGEQEKYESNSQPSRQEKPANVGWGSTSMQKVKRNRPLPTL